MEQHFKSEKSQIEKFLKKIKKIINDEKFDINKQFILDKRKNDFSNSIYSNLNTILYLQYSLKDVVNELKELTFQDYYETIIDVVGKECLLYVFKKKIKGENIYIKLTIRREKIIFCISFHISK